MSNVGKTMVKGHGLRWEGSVVHDDEGFVAASRLPKSKLHAKCGCGDLSPAGISKNAARQWHRQHKADVLAGVEGEARRLYETHGLDDWDALTDLHKDVYRRAAVVRPQSGDRP